MNKDVDDLSARLNRLQLRRCNIISELESVENEIAVVIEEEKKKTETEKRKRRSTPTATTTNQSPAVDRVGEFVSEGDAVKVLTPGQF